MPCDLENIHLGMYFKELTSRECKDLDFHYVLYGNTGNNLNAQYRIS